MRIKSLKLGNKNLTDAFDIKTSLMKHGLNWLNEAEIENAIIEIKNNKLYWYSGIFYFGTWEDGIWLNGSFKWGDWLNGVFYNGEFRGIWHNGIFMNGVFLGGEFKAGVFRDGDKKGGKFFDEKEIKENFVIKFSDFKK
jgi:hypothetical protein